MTFDANTPKITIDIDFHKLSEILGVLSSIAKGESSPQFLENSVQGLQETIPFLPTAVTWMATAMNQVDEAKDRFHESKQQDSDMEAFQDVLSYLDMLCTAKGALAALLCVAEDLKVQSHQKHE